jgi:predicted transcriptional regulator
MRDELKLKSVSIRLDDALRERLEEQARLEDRPISYLVRRALRAEAVRWDRQVGRGRMSDPTDGELNPGSASQSQPSSQPSSAPTLIEVDGARGRGSPFFVDEQR